MAKSGPRLPGQNTKGAAALAPWLPQAHVPAHLRHLMTEDDGPRRISEEDRFPSRRRHEEPRTWT
jgi:hypothetical protein